WSCDYNQSCEENGRA
ncbi:RNA polymerase Rpb1, domain 1 family protein, partial [Vibrio parahaemolyticus EKP-028]